MGFYEYLLVAGAVLAVVFGVVGIPRVVSYAVLLVIAAWPAYSLGGENGWNVVTVLIMTAICFVVFAALYWLGGRFSRRRA